MIRRNFREWVLFFTEEEQENDNASDELPQDVNKYTPDMWYDRLLDDYFDWYSELPEQDLIKLFDYEQQHNPKFSYQRVDFPSGLYVYIEQHNGQTTYVYEGGKDKMFSREEPNEWLQNIEWGERTNEFYGEYADEKFNQEFWAYPPPLYHGTENLQGVLRDGIEARDQTRGISNRGVGAAVYTSTEPESIDSYASDGMVVIDTQSMKRDGFMPFVRQEEPLQEAEFLQSIAYAIGIEDYDISQDYNSEGISPDTVVFYEDIPAKYVSKFEGF